MKNSSIYRITCCYLLASSGSALAHTQSIGYVNNGPGNVTFYYGSYHSDVTIPEGQLKLEGVFGTSFGPIIVNFLILTHEQPLGLDPTKNYFSSGPNSLVPYNLGASYIKVWQGVTFTGLKMGSYTFTYIPENPPSDKWNPNKVSNNLPTYITTSTITLDAAFFSQGVLKTSAPTPNQYSVANALDQANAATPSVSGQTLIANVNLSGSVPNALQQLSGPGLSQPSTVASFTTELLNNSVSTRFSMFTTPGAIGVASNQTPLPVMAYSSTDETKGGPFNGIKKENISTPADEGSKWGSWAIFSGASASHAGNGDQLVSRVSKRSWYGIGGLDYKIDDDRLVGFTFGASINSYSLKDTVSSGRSDGVHLGVYELESWGDTYLGSTLLFGQYNISTNRSVVGVGNLELISGHTHATSANLTFELGHRFQTDYGNVTPFSSLSLGRYWQSGYSERAVDEFGGPGIAGLDMKSINVTSIPLQLGVQLDRTFDFAENLKVTPQVKVALVHEFIADVSSTASFQSLPGFEFTTTSSGPVKNSARVFGGVKLSQSKSAELFLAVDSKLAPGSNSISGKVGVNIKW